MSQRLNSLGYSFYVHKRRRTTAGTPEKHCKDEGADQNADFTEQWMGICKTEGGTQAVYHWLGELLQAGRYG